MRDRGAGSECRCSEDEADGPFSLTSETHLYYLLSGAALWGVAAVLALRLPARRDPAA